MNKKIILTFVLLISAHQEFYTMQSNNNIKIEEVEINNEILEKKYNFWNEKRGKIKDFDRLWVFTDNVPLQYGNSKVWEHGEAYYGLSNGIGCFPSILNFGWLKIGIGDFHINVINAIVNYIRIYVEIKVDYYFSEKLFLEDPDRKRHKNPVWFNSLKCWLFYTILSDTQLFSFKFFNCVKLKIISIGAIVTCFINDDLTSYMHGKWHFNFTFFNGRIHVSKNFFLLSTRIEINISEIINRIFRG